MCENMKECRYCCEKINDKATICNKCGRFQNIFRQYTQTSHGVFVIGVIMAIIAVSGYIKADQKLDNANIALSKANAAFDNAEDALNKANLVEQATQEAAKTFIEINYLKAKTRNQIGGKQQERVHKIIQDDLNRTLKLVFPDDKERNAFVQGIEKKYQQTISSDK